MEREINLLEAENLRLRLQLQVSGMMIPGNLYCLELFWMWSKCIGMLIISDLRRCCLIT